MCVVISCSFPARRRAVGDRTGRPRDRRRLGAGDLRKAAELKPKTVFDALSQASAKQRAQQLGKRLPCGSAETMNNSCL
jgi:hypothetical protein